MPGKIAGDLKKAGLRDNVDDRPERMNAKIRGAQNQKIPYMLVVGDKEMENVRSLYGCAITKSRPMKVSTFIERAKEEIANKV
jgi:threonyl-tRNA synthetase